MLLGFIPVNFFFFWARGRGNKEKVCPDGGIALAKHILSILYAQGLLYPPVPAKEGKGEGGSIAVRFQKLTQAGVILL